MHLGSESTPNRHFRTGAPKTFQRTKNPQQKPPPKTLRMDKNLLLQKLSDLIINLTDADHGDATNIFEAVEQIINECEVDQ